MTRGGGGIDPRVRSPPSDSSTPHPLVINYERSLNEEFRLFIFIIHLQNEKRS